MHLLKCTNRMGQMLLRIMMNLKSLCIRSFCSHLYFIFARPQYCIFPFTSYLSFFICHWTIRPVGIPSFRRTVIVHAHFFFQISQKIKNFLLLFPLVLVDAFVVNISLFIIWIAKSIFFLWWFDAFDDFETDSTNKSLERRRKRKVKT